MRNNRTGNEISSLLAIKYFTYHKSNNASSDYWMRYGFQRPS